MIRFFRSIRQSLLAQGRITRYLTYAIGEIVLVVIGILIALQVNTWNLARKDRATETKYLTGLKADLHVDLIKLRTYMEERDVKVSSALLLLKMEDPVTAADVHRMDSIVWRVFTWRKFVPSTKTMDELIGSGNLSLIQNDSIKSTMLDLSQRYADLAVHIEHMRREYDHYLYDRSTALREMMPFADLAHWVETDTLISEVRTTAPELATLTGQTQALLSDLTFRNGLKLAAMNNHLMRRNGERTHKAVEHLIALIDEDLNKH